MKKNQVIWIIIIVIVVILMVSPRFFRGKLLEGKTSREIANQCVNHEGIGMHIHPELRIIIDGQELQVPSNIGVSSACMKAIHTHDATGKIHIESPIVKDFTLGDFFDVWQQPFNKNELFDKTVDDKHRIVLMVNGVESAEYENLIIRDLDQILIRYEAVE